MLSPMFLLHRSVFTQDEVIDIVEGETYGTRNTKAIKIHFLCGVSTRN